LVLAGDPAAYSAVYGVSVPVFDVFNGKLQSDGETLTLVRPGTNTASELAVAKVRYEGGDPWPSNASGGGTSLQLVDARQDNWRAGNWAAGEAGPQWMYYTITGTASSSSLYIYLESAGDIYLDDIQLVAGNVPGAGPNLLAGGDFESGFPGPWTVSANLSASTLSTAIKHSGNASLHLVASSGGSSQGSSIWQVISPALVANGTYTLSFWYLQSSNGGPLIFRLSGSGIYASLNPAPPMLGQPSCTPGVRNSFAAALATFPSLWINELQADNLTGITNRAGQRVPWLEIYNPSTNAVPLEGLYLANAYKDLTAWAFPVGTVISPKQFKLVFADGQTNLSTANELHTSFTLSSRSGGVALSRLYDGKPQVLDYVNYTNLNPDRSYGSFTDGQSFTRQEFFYPTPGATNNGSSAPLTVAINEWMADNAVTLSDSADSDFEDWFELHNPGTNAVDLGGYYLSDSITNKTQFEIPKNGQYVIPPKGFLLVWADGESKQNNTNRADLHVNFKLDKAGDAIGLFGADGALVDYVTFGSQITDITMGRYPDGGPNIAFLPTATPRAKNSAPNTQPNLAPISNRIVVVGQSVGFFANASDADQPAQALTFSLGAGAPVGAAINSANGYFSWTPVSGPSTNQIEIVVTDNGAPNLSASQKFNIVVMLPPQFQQVSLNGNQLSFGWTTAAGQSYQLEYVE
ncbi:MAG TPA: lamin tail domain-containing protein, partial [Clostridia bacterium]|nr:lamin tail domain-containing protein [Clostridia bacterium]